MGQWFPKDSYIYGDTPNDFFKEQLDLLTPGKLLLPAAGEGRNAVCAAQQGWAVDAFDISQSGQQKALKLAEEKQVSINYFIDNYEEVEVVPETYNALGLIYAHMHDDIRRYIRR
ncbi:MAG: class I SAM-dependent methyltransferase [Fodinibius sp.]|nr:class I SAM-dependent methyltransferase [Fodinibius sp.]